MKVAKNVTEEKRKREQKYRRPALRKRGVIIDVEGIRVIVGKCQCNLKQQI